MVTTHRSDLVEQLEKAFTDEAYDGGMGVLSPEQFTSLVRTLAGTAAGVLGEHLSTTRTVNVLREDWERLKRAEVLGEKAHTPTDDEREALRIAELDARQSAYRKEREDWYVDHEAEPEIASNAFFRGWDAAVDGGFSRAPFLSDSRVEAAARELLPEGLGPWDRAKPEWQEHARHRARAALRAASAVTEKGENR